MKIDIAAVNVEVVEDANGWVVEAMWQEYRIGQAYCRFLEKSEIQLYDLAVESNVPVPNTFGKKLLNALGAAFTGEDFRGNGVGSLILDRLISESKRRGIAIIWGSVLKDDVERTPFLLEWFKRRGFSISAPDKRCLPNAVKKIQLDLVID